jgi:hypothetical protein
VRGVRDDTGDEVPVLGGECGSLIYPDDIAFFTDEEREEWRRELQEKVARKRPVGFAPWPDNQGGTDEAR